MRLPNNNISSTVKVTQNLYAFLTLVASVSIPVALCDADNALGAPDDANYDANYDESQVPAYTLPDPLVDSAGTPVRTPAEWPERRRPEILKLFEEHVYGRTPTQKLPHIRHEVQSAAVGDEAPGLKGATRKLITIHLGDDKQPRIDVLLYLPASRSKRTPCFLGLNFYGNHTVHDDPQIPINPRWMRPSGAGIVGHRATEESRGTSASRWQVETLLKHGYGVATAYYGDIDPDNYQNDFSDGVHPLFYGDGQTAPADDQWGAIGAWAWGLSRILDYLQSDPDVDGERVAVLGHSRLGKTALWAGAQDQRFAMVISSNSGCGGAALYRRCFGERIHNMVQGIGYWFCRAHHQYARRENELPVDQHLLMALVAPRPLYVASASEDGWADPKGEFLAAAHATPVYQLLGRQGLPTGEWPAAGNPIHGTIGYHLREGKHDVKLYDWEQYLKFADRHWK